MPVIYRKYGDTVEITTYEKKPSKKAISRKIRQDTHGLLSPRRIDSLKRTRRLLVSRVSSAIEELGSPLLVTLTFAGDSIQVFDNSQALSRFLLRLRLKYPNSASVSVPEFSPRGRFHYHLLVFGLPLSMGDLRNKKGLYPTILEYGTERETRLLAGMWKRGYVDCTRTDGSYKLAYYLAKYLNKSHDNPALRGIRLLRFSKNFPREIVVRDELAEFLKLRYDDLQAVHSWDVDSPFLGRMSRKYYKINTNIC